jgi:DNA polymerase III alpha subunit|tara:strand:- start:4302 stop:4811 length:510 start_codon:yes stop_codon:yes gene_type:complete
MLDKNNRYISDENTGVEMLYHGKELSNAEYTLNEDIAKFQEFAHEMDLNLLKIIGGEDFDRINTYNIPEHYKELDVREYVSKLVESKCRDSDISVNAKARVEMELAMFEERKLFPVLQILIYIVDTMRKHSLVWGVGRGSSVASYVLYVLDVHKINSLTYNLDIKEFLK